ncbi:GNAT family N-acetyltransferase [Agrococcus casei]|uniref:GNAT family N-acetyltransferase n=1 Tax=Agrococcus casei TaxID=343512 RepID=UPI003F91B2ED
MPSALPSNSITFCERGRSPPRHRVHGTRQSRPDVPGWSFDSARVVVARVNGELVGLARIIGDGATICYLQDVLVNPSAQRTGLGRALVREAFAPYSSVRQHVLITDEEAGQKSFYESVGFAQLGESVPGRAFVRFAN